MFWPKNRKVDLLRIPPGSASNHKTLVLWFCWCSSIALVLLMLSPFPPNARPLACIELGALALTMQGYKSLFAPLLMPAVWERKGNIPAVTRLLQASCGKPFGCLGRVAAERECAAPFWFVQRLWTKRRFIFACFFVFHFVFCYLLTALWPVRCGVHDFFLEPNSVCSSLRYLSHLISCIYVDV